MFCVLFQNFCICWYFFNLQRVWPFKATVWMGKKTKTNPQNKNIFKKHCIIIVMKETTFCIYKVRHFYFQRLTRVWRRPLVARQWTEASALQGCCFSNLTVGSVISCITEWVLGTFLTLHIKFCRFHFLHLSVTTKLKHSCQPRPGIFQPLADRESWLEAKWMLI